MGWPGKEPGERTPGLIPLPPSVLQPAPLTGQTQEKPEATGVPGGRAYKAVSQEHLWPLSFFLRKLEKPSLENPNIFPFFFLSEDTSPAAQEGSLGGISPAALRNQGWTG